MNITLNIQADNPAELQNAIAGLAGIVGGVVTNFTTTLEEPDKTEKPKRTSRAASKPEPAKQSDPEPANTSDDEPDQEPETTGGDEEETEVPSVVDLRAAAQEKGKTPEAKKAIKALLDKYGSKSISDVPEKKRAAFLAELNEL